MLKLQILTILLVTKRSLMRNLLNRNNQTTKNLIDLQSSLHQLQTTKSSKRFNIQLILPEIRPELTVKKKEIVYASIRARKMKLPLGSLSNRTIKDSRLLGQALSSPYKTVLDNQ